MTAALRQKAQRIRLLLFDVDGVLTDGGIILHPDGAEAKRFDIRDGTGIVWAQRAGLLTGVLSARASAATAQRTAQLGMAIVYQGVPSKAEAFDEILTTHNLRPDEVAYMGDDLLDLPVLQRVGLSAAPADAVAEVRRRVDFVAPSRGGAGAARDLIETVLQAQDRWQALVDGYAGEDGRS
ncbi:MAG TPA: HAD-IIIA family hydrolase [Vicinamibacterales bacterium]|jgi:3-deoxy-D-manno-octulosonate 8-phosphate phosphatase (KDO 8-P phosphatase)